MHPPTRGLDTRLLLQKSKEAGLLNCKQLGVLIAALQSVTEKEYITTRAMTDILQKLASASGADAFPELWRTATFKQMRDALALLDPHLSSYVDWLHVITSLVLQVRPHQPHDWLQFFQRAGYTTFTLSPQSPAKTCIRTN